MSSVVFVFPVSLSSLSRRQSIIIISPTAMQNLPGRRRSDAGVQEASHAQATSHVQAALAGPKPVDATETPPASSEPCDNSMDTPSDDPFPLPDRSASTSLNRPLTVSFIVEDIKAGYVQTLTTSWTRANTKIF
jgi:hypothetical protein